MTNRMNLGCGSVHFEGWVNVDKNDNGHCFVADIQDDSHLDVLGYESYDYIFCNHMLSDFDHHELPGVLENIRLLLVPGGTVHFLVPNVISAIAAWIDNKPDWFPQGDDMPNLDERFCTFITWFGESKSVFTPAYLLNLGRRAGFYQVGQVNWGRDPHDDREGECIVAEFIK